MSTGRISSFQSLGTVDGPGVRCVIFMQGCPLRCVCCHNPETWDYKGGEETETDTLLKKVLRFRNYFGQTGGVTLSGGEPLLQADFAYELFVKLKEAGINTCLDTSGAVINETVKKLLDHTDIVILDHKYPDDDSYRKYTGMGIEKAEAFLNILEEKEKTTWLRRVIIPGLNDSAEAILQLKHTAGKYSCVKKTELLPFRRFCVEKYQNLGINFPLEAVKEPDIFLMEKLNHILHG